jgi:hypothetical protein
LCDISPDGGDRGLHRINWGRGLICGRLVERAAQFAHNHVARQAQLAEDLARRTHYVGQIFRRDYDQRDRQDYYDFDYAQW